MLCFLSGAVSNVPDYQSRFEQASKDVRFLGFVPVNPDLLSRALLNEGVPDTREFCLDIDFAALKKCDVVYFLTNWQDSVGARKEHCIAQAYDIPIIYQENLDYYKSIGLTGQELLDKLCSET